MREERLPDRRDGDYGGYDMMVGYRLTVGVGQSNVKLSQRSKID
jgi:hypothetical protein